MAKFVCPNCKEENKIRTLLIGLGFKFMECEVCTLKILWRHDKTSVFVTTDPTDFLQNNKEE